MKKLQNHIFGALAALALTFTFAFSGPAAHAAANPDAASGDTATVISVAGKATVFQNGKSERVKKGMILGKGAKIATGLGQVKLDIGIHGVVTIDSRSEMTIDELSRPVANPDAGKTVFNLTKGALLGSAKKISAESEYQVKTAKGVAGIRGTEYLILAVGIFKCASGQLVIVMVAIDPTTLQPKVFTVTPGNKLDATATIEKLTGMTAAESAEVVKKASGGPVSSGVIVIPAKPTEAFISPVRGNNGRLIQHIDVGDITPP